MNKNNLPKHVFEAVQSEIFTMTYFYGNHETGPPSQAIYLFVSVIPMTWLPKKQRQFLSRTFVCSPNITGSISSSNPPPNSFHLRIPSRHFLHLLHCHPSHGGLFLKQTINFIYHLSHGFSY